MWYAPVKLTGAFFMEMGAYDGHHQHRRPSCVTEVRMGSTGITVSGY
jgi:hypothetical protein